MTSKLDAGRFGSLSVALARQLLPVRGSVWYDSQTVAERDLPRPAAELGEVKNFNTLLTLGPYSDEVVARAMTGLGYTAV